MLYITKLLIVWRCGLCLAGNNVRIIQNVTTWNEALGHCVVQNSRLADISDIETDQTCNTIFKTNKTKSFWTGNFFKLSSRISIEGCYAIHIQTIDVGFKLLHDCFELCTRRMNKSGFFAYRALFRPSCLCDLNFNNSLPENLEKVNKNQCFKTNIDFFWWVYKVHFDDFNTGNETCHQPACIYSDVKYDNVCGQISNNTDYMKGHIPKDKLPFICERNVKNSTSVNETIFAGYFRFGFNASVKSDNMEKSAVAFKCKAISCNSDNAYHIILQNCNSTTVGYLCVFNNSHESRNTSQTHTTEIASTTTSTILKSLNSSPKISQYHVSTSAYTTTSKIMAQSNFQRKTSDVLSHSSTDNVDNSPVVITYSTQSSTEENLKPTRLNITPSMIYRSLYVSKNATDFYSYTTSNKITTQSNFQQQTSDVLSHSNPDNIGNVHVVATSPVRTSTKRNLETIWRYITSSHTSSYTTVLKEKKMLESTAVASETSSDSHSKIGLILGSLMAAVVVIVAVVLLVICQLRHKRTFMKKRICNDSPINDSSFPNIDDTSNQSSRDVLNTMYDMHTVSGVDTQFGLVDVALDNTNNIRNYEYAVVVKNNQSGNQVVEKNCDTNGENSDGMLTRKSNRLNHVRPRNGNNSSNNEYAVVVKNNQSGNQVIEQNCETNGENSDDLLESEYDKLNHVRPRSGKDSCSIYDSALGFRDVYDATYNTTVCRGIDNRDDSVYDHT